MKYKDGHSKTNVFNVCVNLTCIVNYGHIPTSLYYPFLLVFIFPYCILILLVLFLKKKKQTIWLSVLKIACVLCFSF